MSIISRLRRRFWLAGGLMILPALAQGAPEAAGVAGFHKDIQPLLKEYCYDCHGDGETNGNIAFDALKSDDQILNHDLWAKVLKNTRAGLMPPRKKARPTAEEQKELEAWVKYSAFGIDAKNPDPGRVTVRRLNRVEYHNTIHDLMGVDYNTDVEFPPDDTGYGFDDIGDVLTVSPLLLEKYLTAARAIVEEAVPTVPWVVPQKTIDGSKFQSANETHATTGPRGTMLSLTYYQPALVGTTFHQNSSGDCEIALQLAVKGTFYYDPGRCRVTFKLDDQELMTKEFAWEDNRTFTPFVFPEKLEAGDHKLSFELKPLTSLDQKVDSLDMRLVSVNIRGPLDEQHRTRPKNYDRFFTKDAPADANGRRAYAHELLEKFASRAYRRPADGKTVDRLVGLAESVYGQPGKTFEAGVAYAMEAVLASPRFLFRIEQPEAGTAAGGYPLVDEYSLASRLSYFLWSTMPDDELMGLAQRGELRKNLAEQVKRMLADPRAEALVDNFTGQWLQTRDVEGANINARVVLARDGMDIPMFRGGAGRRRPVNGAGAPPSTPNNAAASTNSGSQRTSFQVRKDAESFPPIPQLDGDIKSAMERETQMYFAGIVREDRDVSELIDSDYTYLNQKLANFYGLTNLDVKGQQMRRVTLPADCPRGGILTQGSVLVVTSNPDRTSPVKRGLFIQNSVLGSPPPPPPPNIPALEAAEKNVQGHEPTLRESLAMHRDKPECAMCHARLDPIGLAFENFNAMGMWREKERGQTIDPSGQLVTGENFTNAVELKRILATKHRLDFYRCLTEKLLTYATGRGMEYYDTETIDEIVQRLDEQQGHFSALLMGVIDSAPFQKERSRANDVFSDAPEPAEKSAAARANPKGATP